MIQKSIVSVSIRPPNSLFQIFLQTKAASKASLVTSTSGSFSESLGGGGSGGASSLMSSLNSGFGSQGSSSVSQFLDWHTHGTMGLMLAGHLLTRQKEPLRAEDSVAVINWINTAFDTFHDASLVAVLDVLASVLQSQLIRSEAQESSSSSSSYSSSSSSSSSPSSSSSSSSSSSVSANRRRLLFVAESCLKKLLRKYQIACR